MRALVIGLAVLTLSAVPALAADDCAMRQYEIDKVYGKRFDKKAAEVRGLAKQAMALCKAGKKEDAMKMYDEANKKGGIVASTK